MTSATSDWKSTACILCECNCGIEVQLGGEGGRHLVKIRGDKSHPGSQGYACEKPSRLDYYQNGRDRITSPMRRRPDGSFEEIDWDTAIREVADKLAAIRDEHGGSKIMYYGGGGQGNHLPGAYSPALRSALGMRYASNALAQEKTGEFWVNGKMFGTIVRGDFEHCEVAFFLGKNPWHSHGIPRARIVLKEIAKDPERTMIVVDPRRSETADIADVHLAVRPGADAWLMAALIAVLVQENLVDHDFLDQHTSGFDQVLPHFDTLVIADYCRKAGIDEAQVRETARRLAAAESVAFYEDLGIQMNRHSTLVSYLNRLLWALTGNFAKKGAMNTPIPFAPIASGMMGERGASKSQNRERTTPVTGSRIIAGLMPCNVIPDEILTDHPDRFRAMFVESANPVHSLADSPRMREAVEALDLVVVVDVAMTETARLADYVLPVATQFEKPEAVFFNFEFPENVVFLRKPILTPPDGVLSEPEIHARLVEALGELPRDAVGDLRDVLAAGGREAFAGRFLELTSSNPKLMSGVGVLLYRTLGESLPEELRSGAVLWGAAQILSMRAPNSLRRAGFEGEPPKLGDALFEKVLMSPTGVVFAVEEYEESWQRVGTPEGRIQVAVDELFETLDGLQSEEPFRPDAEFPLVLSAGERRSFTANTIYRDPDWRRKDREGALRISPEDAERFGVGTDDLARLTTRRGSCDVVVEVSDRMRPGHVSLPNGQGITNAGDAEAEGPSGGTPTNELTAGEDRDPFAGTPWHKSVPARLEALS